MTDKIRIFVDMDGTMIISSVIRLMLTEAGERKSRHTILR